MGKGNVCTKNQYEGLFYIDNEYLDQYRKKNSFDELMVKSRRELSNEELDSSDWILDEDETELNWQAVKSNLIYSIRKKFSSFTPCSEWIDQTQFAILENNLFYIVVEDNEWSMAIKLIQKEYGCLNYSGLQKKHYQRYLNGIKDALFEQFDTLGTYAGPWTSGLIEKGKY